MPSRCIDVTSKLEKVGSLPLSGDPSMEPSFIGANTALVRNRCGAVVSRFLNGVNRFGWSDHSFGVFVYNTPLVANSWPTKAPGWHVDGQHGTDLDTPYRLAVEHLISAWTYRGRRANTEYALGRTSLMAPEVPSPPPENQFSWLHTEVDRSLREGSLQPFELADGDMYHHDDSAIHRTPWILEGGDRILMIATRFACPLRQLQANYSGQEMCLRNRVYTPTLDGLGWGRQMTS